MLSALDRLKQAFEDTLKLASDHESAIRCVRKTVADIRQRCPGLQLECVFNGLPVGGGSYEGVEAQENAAELVGALGESQRGELRSFVEEKLAETERVLAAA